MYRGSSTGLALRPSWRIESDEAFSHLGNDIASAGDVNGDGFEDVVVSAYGGTLDDGEVEVYLGSPAGLGKSPDWELLPDRPSTAMSTAPARRET